MRIGETRKIETGVPRPIRIPREEPRPKPDREPEPVREPEKVRVPVRVGGLTSQEISYLCPICEREMRYAEVRGEDVLVCPKHGVIEERFLEEVY